MNVTDENSRSRSRIRIRTKMSRIRNTGMNTGLMIKDSSGQMTIGGIDSLFACDGGEEECGHPLEAADGPLQPLLHLLVVQRHLL